MKVDPAPEEKDRYERILDVHLALEKLAERDENLAQIVEQRFLGGYTIGRSRSTAMIRSPRSVSSRGDSTSPCSRHPGASLRDTESSRPVFLERQFE